MRTLVPLFAALGLTLMYSGFTAPPKRRARAVPLRRLDEIIAGAGFERLTAVRLLSGCVVLFFVTLILVAGVTRSLVVATAFGLLAATGPVTLIGGRRQKRLARFRDAWPDAIATLIAAVRSGVSLPEACVSLLERGPGDLSPGFEAFTAAYRSTGSFSAGLKRMKDVFADPVADRIVIALGLANDVGGSDLVRVLRTLSDFTREDLRVRKEIYARWSWTVTAARVAAAAPWVVLLLMASRPEAAAAYSSGAGALVILIGGFVTIIGYRLMLRAARLPEEQRIEG